MYIYILCNMYLYIPNSVVRSFVVVILLSCGLFTLPYALNTNWSSCFGKAKGHDHQQECL